MNPTNDNSPQRTTAAANDAPHRTESADEVIRRLIAERAALPNRRFSARHRDELDDLYSVGIAVERGELPRAAYVLLSHLHHQRLKRECVEHDKDRAFAAMLAIIDEPPMARPTGEQSSEPTATIAEQRVTPDAPTIVEPSAPTAPLTALPAPEPIAATPSVADRHLPGDPQPPVAGAPAPARCADRLLPNERATLAYLAARCAASEETTDEVCITQIAQHVGMSWRGMRDLLSRLTKRDHIERLVDADKWGTHEGFRYRVHTRATAPPKIDERPRRSPRRRRTTKARAPQAVDGSATGSG